MSVMAALCVNMLRTNMLLSIFILSGALAACPEDSALLITTTEQMEALSGSCLQIPCNFRAKPEKAFNGRRTVAGVWIKSDSRLLIDPKNVIYNSSGAVSIYPMRITGNLSQRDCTTLFSDLSTKYTDTYFFRVESEAFKATAFCDRLQITVRDSPWRPNITISGDLKEKESVTITCSDLKALSFRENLNKEPPLSLLISPTGPVSVGSMVTLTCSCQANPPVDSYVWFMTSGDKLEMIKADTKVYSFEVTKLDRDKLFYCSCGNHLDIQISAGSQLLFEGDEHWGKMTVMKTVGIIIMVSTLVIFECWFRSRRPNKPEAGR
ncbi:sialic acid-binding Ig-like lectin 9 [Neolamprologus brichardi]|uniref:sialic acid-binding Ig-like lectin 9 n=1 Tax=Neolamprologus brichardi TaxID=32507 RepID=UPI0016436CB1|nr:sialic acid-binding Ig-like lectin 9 [Neolamprologus brichardi]